MTRMGLLRSLFQRIGVMFSLLCIGCLQVGYAQQMVDKYSIVVPIEEQTRAAFNSATQQGLMQLLIELSGATNITEDEAVKQALQQPEDLLERYYYTVIADEMQLQLHFSSPKIQRLLTESTLPQHTVLPGIVLWLIIQDGWEYDFVSAQYPPAVVELITTVSDQQAVPVILPVFDWIELSRLSLQDIEQERVAKIAELSERYDAAAIVIGTLSRHDTQWQGEGLLVYQSEWLPWHVQQDSQAALIESLLLTLKDQFAKQSVLATDVQIRVEQVQSSDDYQRINDYLQSLPLVDKIQLVQIETNAVVYQLALNADVHALLRELGTGDLLTQVRADADELRYRLVS